MNDQAYAAAAERLALAKEIKRQEANLRALSDMIERKRARLNALEREAESRDGLAAAFAQFNNPAPDRTLYSAAIINGRRAAVAS